MMRFVLNHSMELAALLIGAGGYTAGRMHAPKAVVEERVASLRECQYTDGRTIASTNPFGLYLENKDNTDITCTVQRQELHLGAHRSWWLAKGSSLYECVDESEKSYLQRHKPPKRKDNDWVDMQLQRACVKDGDVCTDWHNATVLFNWHNEHDLKEFPIIVCDEWGTR